MCGACRATSRPSARITTCCAVRGTRRATTQSNGSCTVGTGCNTVRSAASASVMVVPVLGHRRRPCTASARSSSATCRHASERQSVRKRSANDVTVDEALEPVARREPRELLGQCRRGEFLRHARMGVSHGRPLYLTRHYSPGAGGVHRRLVQSRTHAFIARVPTPAAFEQNLLRTTRAA